jgi:hypothetical protein
MSKHETYNPDLLHPELSHSIPAQCGAINHIQFSMNNSPEPEAFTVTMKV